MPILEKNNPLWRFKEAHISGIEPKTWVCAWCGKSLAGEPHYLGMTHGRRYCERCMNKGRADKDVTSINDDELLRDKNLYYGSKDIRIRRL